MHRPADVGCFRSTSSISVSSCKRSVADPCHAILLLSSMGTAATRADRLDRPSGDLCSGAERLDDVLAWCAELAIQAVTLWVFSTDNLSRPPAELAGILDAVQAKVRALARDPLIHRRQVHVRAVGRLGLLPPSTREAIAAAERATASYDAMTLTIAAAYGGREEVVDAVRALLREAAGVATISRLSPCASSRPRSPAISTPAGCRIPDLIIRTSGEVRLRGFCSGRAPTATLLHRRQLAGVPQDRLSPRPPLLSAASSSLWALMIGPQFTVCALGKERTLNSGGAGISRAEPRRSCG